MLVSQGGERERRREREDQKRDRGDTCRTKAKSSSHSTYQEISRSRHLSPSQRPTFAAIVDDYLSADDEAILTLSAEDRLEHTQANVVGAKLSEGYFLYTDLQKEYT